MNSNVLNKAFPILMDKAYTGNLTCNELILLLERLTWMKKFEIPYPTKVDYFRIEEGLNLRVEKILSGKVSEPEIRSFIGNETVNEMELNVRNLYKRLYELKNDILYMFSNRRQFMDIVNTGDDTSLYSLQKKRYRVFDKEMLNVIIKRYSVSDNDIKSQLANLIKEIVFETDVEDENKESISNLEIFEQEINKKQASETDEFTKVINREFLKELDKKLSLMKEKLQRMEN